MMATGDPMTYCRDCGETYYSVVGHNCPRRSGGAYNKPSQADYFWAEREVQEFLAANCNDCYTPYPFPLDTRVEDDLWRRISPDGEGNGLLCANCIVARLARLDPDIIVVKMTPVWVEEYE